MYCVGFKKVLPKGLMHWRIQRGFVTGQLVGIPKSYPKLMKK